MNINPEGAIDMGAKSVRKWYTGITLPEGERDTSRANKLGEDFMRIFIIKEQMYDKIIVIISWVVVKAISLRL